MTDYIEKDCTIEHEGHKFECGGAIVTDDYVVAYMAATFQAITDWHGKQLSTDVKVTASWPIRSFMSSTMYQIKARINGKWYTGRTLGAGMLIRMRPCK